MGNEHMGNEATVTPGLGVVSVNIDRVTDLARACEQTRQSIASDLARLIDKIHDLSGTALGGTPDAVLQEQSEKLNRGLTRILDALDNLAGQMSRASVEFGVQDGDAARTIRDAAETTGDSFVLDVLTKRTS